MSELPDPPDRRPLVAVVFGGRSPEHAISCVSAGSILESVDRERYDVVAVGIAPDGRWVLAPDDPKQFALSGRHLPAVDGGGPGVALLGDPTSPGLVARECATRGPLAGAPTEVDVVFPVLHGPFGEDGTIQGLLELAGIPYVGSGVLASAAALDKEYMKLLFAARGLPIGEYAVLRRGQPLDAVHALGLPVFVKPARAGSSLGITKVTDPEQLPAALADAWRHDPKVIIEAAVSGREIECGVLAAGAPGEPAEASLPAEIRVTGGREFYDFEAKYLDEATEFDVPAQIGAARTAEVQALARAAFGALECEGLARVDFFLRPDGSLLVNEINTMPGFTPASMFPRMWAASGVDYPALVDRLITDALRGGVGLR
ncbi:MAG: D-alanine--D-alanine ligase family protein [Frankiaceae bacterium]